MGTRKAILVVAIVGVIGVAVRVGMRRGPAVAERGEERGEAVALATGPEVAAPADPTPVVEAVTAPAEVTPVATASPRPASRPIVQSPAESAEKQAARAAAAARRKAQAEADASEEHPVPLPVARAALDFVGMDPEAEAVWYAAINDPTLSHDARKDLIEDLNQNGFADTRNLTPDDLPMIVSRLELIEQLAGDAMDQTNFEAFAEAYKDLWNMYHRVTSR